MLDETVISPAGEDQVVEERYAEGIGRAFKPRGNLAILRAWLEPTRRVVMSDNDGTGAVGYRIRINLAWMHDC